MSKEENKVSDNEIKEHFELMDKRNEVYKGQIDSLSIGYLDSLGKSELEKKVENHYKGFNLSQFFNHIAKK